VTLKGEDVAENKYGKERYGNMAEIRLAAQHSAHSSHWFSKGSMAFFSSVILDGVLHARYFVTSEKQGEDSARRYSVRMIDADGEVSTIGEFMGYATARAARQAASFAAADAAREEREQS